MTFEISKLRAEPLESLKLLDDASDFLNQFYFRKEIEFCSTGREFIRENLLDDTKWLKEIWNYKELYYFNLKEDGNSLFFGSYADIILGIDKIPLYRKFSELTLTGFRLKNKINYQETEELKRIKKLEDDMSEIKQLLKKMVV